MMYGIRVRKPGGTWRRVKQIRNPKGIWRTRAAAEYILAKHRRRGWQGHVFEIVDYPNATHYSKHFSRDELDCKCGCIPSREVQKNLAELATGLELMRMELGSLGVLSGHRCKEYNDKIGGARNSRHILGEAADLAVPSGMQDEYVAAAKKVKIFLNGGIGVYPNGGVHVDHRPWIARWTSFTR